jgi:hypothetical protein
LKTLIVIGSALLLISVNPIWRLVDITVQQRAAKARYEFFSIHENEVRLAGHTIQLKDRIAQGHYGEHDRRAGPVTILIDGKDFSIESEVIIRPKFRDDNRYFSWVHMVRLRDKNSGQFLIAIVQRIGELVDGEWGDLSKVKFRIIYVSEAGAVTEETFPYADRQNPPYRFPIVIRVSPEVEMYFPTLLDPFLIPGVSSLVGILLVGIGIKGVLRARQKTGSK